MQPGFPDWARTMRLATWEFTSADMDITEAEVDRRARNLASKGINAVVSWCCHYRWDFVADWPRIQESVRRAVEACHRHGIHYIEHHSASFCARLPKPGAAEVRRFNRSLPGHSVQKPPLITDTVRYGRHRVNDWYLQNLKKGGADYREFFFSVSLCPNNPDYQREYLAYLKTYLSATGADGIMSDDVTMGRDRYACVCPWCMKLFRSETGFTVPKQIDHPFWSDLSRPDTKAWVDFRARSIRRHYERINTMLDTWPRPILHTACATTICSPVSAETYAKQAVYNTTFMEMMNHAATFYNWGALSPELRVYRALARRHNNPSFGLPSPQAKTGEQFFSCALCRMEDHAIWMSHVDPLTPRRGPECEWPLWEAQHENLFAASYPVADVAVLFSDTTRRYYRGIRHEYYGNEFSGWCEALQEAGIDCSVILEPDLTPDGLRAYRTLVLPNAACLSDAQCRAIAAYVRRGGRLVASHETSMFDERGRPRSRFGLAACLGLDYVRTAFEDHYQLQARLGDDRFLAGVTSLIPHRAPQVIVRPRHGTLVAATSMVDCGGQGRETIPAITERRFGRGQVAYLAGKPGILVYSPGVVRTSWDGEEPNRFLDYRIHEWGRVIANAVRVVTGPRRLELIGAKRGVLFRGYCLQDGSLAIHVLNASGSFPTHRSLVPATAKTVYPRIADGSGDAILEYRPGRAVKQALLYSPDGAEEMPLRLRRQGSAIQVHIPSAHLKRCGIVRLILKNRKMVDRI